MCVVIEQTALSDGSVVETRTTTLQDGSIKKTVTTFPPGAEPPQAFQNEDVEGGRNPEESPTSEEVPAAAETQSPTKSMISSATDVKSNTKIFFTYLGRCFGWRLREIEPTENEMERLSNAGVENPTLRSYLAWRRSQMLLSIPVLLSAAVTGLVNIFQAPSLTGSGNFLYNLPNIAGLILTLSVVAALGFPTEKLRVWPKWRLSSKIIRAGFFISLVLPIIPAIIPLKYLIRDDYLHDDDALNATLYLSMGFDHFINTIPVLVSVPSAMIAGALRIRGLLPDSSLSSWILTTTAPFLSLVVIAAAIIFLQFSGSLTLMIGVVCRCLAPWFYVIRRGLYVKAPSEETEKAVDNNQKIILSLNLVGLFLIIFWMLRENFLSSEDVQQNAGQFTKFLLEVWGRFLASTVVFTDALLRMTITNWRAETNSREVDDEYESIEAIISKKKSPGNESGEVVSNVAGV